MISGPDFVDKAGLLQNVNKSRVPKPTPDSRVSVLFVVCFLVILAVIGVSGWFYLNESLRTRPEAVTARAEIEKPVAVTPPIEPDKPVSEVERKAEPQSSVSKIPDIPPAPPIIAATPQADTTIPDAGQKAEAVDNPLLTQKADIPGPLMAEPEIEPSPIQEESATESEAKVITPDLNPATKPFDRESPEKPAATVLTPTTDQLPTADKTAPSTEPLAEPPLPEDVPASDETAASEQIVEKKIEPQLPETAANIEKEPISESEPEAMLPEVVVQASPSEQDDKTKDVTRKDEQGEATPPEVTAMDDDAPATSEAGDTQTLSVEPTKVPDRQPQNDLEGSSTSTAVAAPEPAKTPAATEPLLAQKLPWQENAQPFEDPKNLPRIAIVISEMGVSDTYTNAAIKNLPANMTLAFNPYARNLQKIVTEARDAGHEVLLQLPMEPKGYPAYDPGPHALLTNLSAKENLARLNWALERFTGYVGITNQMGSKFTASAENIQPVLAEVKSRGLLYLDSRTASDSVAASIAHALEIPVAINNRFLDHKANGETIDARLEILEEIAKRTGSAIGIGYPHPLTFEHLRAWAATLAERGIVLAPISALVNRQEIK